TWSRLKPSDCVRKNRICWCTTYVQMISVMAVTNCMITSPFRSNVPFDEPVNLPFKTCMGLNPDNTMDGYEPESSVPASRMENTSPRNLSDTSDAGLNDRPHRSPKAGSRRNTAIHAITMAATL